MENNSIIYTFTTEVSELKLNKLTNSYYFNFKYSISDNEYHTVDLTGYNQYQAEGIRKDFIDMISNMSKIAQNLSKQIESGDILNTSHNIKLEGQKPINNEPFTLGMYTNDFSGKVKDMFPDNLKYTFIHEKEKCDFLELTDTQQEARERYITIEELKQQINKLSEKNKKLKSKNRKLKKQLTITTGE